jgi:hypothetical protein
VQRDVEARLLTGQERADVDASHFPAILALSRQELVALIRRLREYRDRAQTIARQQRREMRGKSEARGASPARDNLGTVQKAQVLAQAVKRANSELARHDDPEPGLPSAAEPTSTQVELTRKAFEQRQAARAVRHPSAGRTANTGMRSNPSGRGTVGMDPREIGRVSQATKAAQAKRDN